MERSIESLLAVRRDAEKTLRLAGDLECRFVLNGERCAALAMMRYQACQLWEFATQELREMAP